MAKCKGTTKQGARCKREAVEGQAYCALHLGSEPAPGEGPLGAHSGPPARRVVQMQWYDDLLVLCDDGTMWLHSASITQNGGWQQVPGPEHVQAIFSARDLRQALTYELTTRLRERVEEVLLAAGYDDEGAADLLNDFAPLIDGEPDVPNVFRTVVDTLRKGGVRV